MSVDQIVTDIDFLQQVSKPTTKEEVAKLHLRDRIIASNKTAWTEGAGLAAIQIGVPLMYAWFSFKDKDEKVHEIELINPKIINQSGVVIIGKEGCLSLPDQWFRTMRYEKTMYRNNDQVFTAEGWTAIILQHEIDHFFGMLCTSRVQRENKIGRNQPCPLCSSGKKYKKCCLK